MPGICSTVCSYVCSPCVLVKNLLCGQPKKVKVDDATTADDFNDPRFDVEYGTGRGDGSFDGPPHSTQLHSSLSPPLSLDPSTYRSCAVDA